jgi:L-ascorbate metabolism protein UlaG (beta-lactamase superfamily)
MKRVLVLAAAVLGLFASNLALANTVKVTPLGSHDGEFWRLDRALIFEDPDGTRILYDAGRTVAGSDDPRLGKIDAILVSHVHGDHVGDKHITAVNEGSCAKPEFKVSALPDSNTVKIAVAKKADIITGSEMPKFFAKQLALAGGDAAKSRLVRFGAMTSKGGVQITTVPAAHSNGLAPGFLRGDFAEHLADAGVTAYVGPPTGYILKFSNGLVVYLSGDTGMTAEQKEVVGAHYQPDLAVMNIGGTFTTGPTEAAYVINEMVKPNSVIASHANEPATKNGKVLDNTRTAAFTNASNVPVHIPLSGKTMEFDADGQCKNGC